jgi:hypothetical protein
MRTRQGLVWHTGACALACVHVHLGMHPGMGPWGRAQYTLMIHAAMHY